MTLASVSPFTMVPPPSSTTAPAYEPAQSSSAPPPAVVRMGDAIVHAGEGCARCEVQFQPHPVLQSALAESHSPLQVLFNAVIFRPFVGEICRGKIAGCTPEGITLTLGFFDNINVAPHRLQVWSFPSRRTRFHPLNLTPAEPIVLRRRRRKDVGLELQWRAGSLRC